MLSEKDLESSQCIRREKKVHSCQSWHQVYVFVPGLEVRFSQKELQAHQGGSVMREKCVVCGEPVPICGPENVVIHARCLPEQTDSKVGFFQLGIYYQVIRVSK